MLFSPCKPLVLKARVENFKSHSNHDHFRPLQLSTCSWKNHLTSQRYHPYYCPLTSIYPSSTGRVARNSMRIKGEIIFKGWGALNFNCCSLMLPLKPKLPESQTWRVQPHSWVMNSANCIVNFPMLFSPSTTTGLVNTVRIQRGYLFGSVDPWYMLLSQSLWCSWSSPIASSILQSLQHPGGFLTSTKSRVLSNTFQCLQPVVQTSINTTCIFTLKFYKAKDRISIKRWGIWVLWSSSLGVKPRSWGGGFSKKIHLDHWIG